MGKRSSVGPMPLTEEELDVISLAKKSTPSNRPVQMCYKEHEGRTGSWRKTEGVVDQNVRPFCPKEDLRCEHQLFPCSAPTLLPSSAGLLGVLQPNTLSSIHISTCRSTGAGGCPHCRGSNWAFKKQLKQSPNRSVICNFGNRRS